MISFNMSRIYYFAKLYVALKPEFDLRKMKLYDLRMRIS